MKKMNEDKKRFLISQIAGATQISPSDVAESIWMADGETTLGYSVRDISKQLSTTKYAKVSDALKEIRNILVANQKELIDELDSIVNAVKD